MKQYNSPRLTLVGAGPGDPDLITIKGLKKLAEADIVLYDALINTELLKYAPGHAPRIFVGKRAGMHYQSQEEINRMIVQYAYEYGHVVRLKGGDPCIFGRGFEEFRFASDHRIPVEIIPGISSATSLPVLQNLPLTCRGISEGFWVITGTTRSGKLSEDIKLAARSTATVVILMGMRKLTEILDVYRQEGKSDLGIMIIQNGTMADEQIITGKVDSIKDQVHEKNLGPPSAIIIGEVIDYALPVIEQNKNLNYMGETSDIYRRSGNIKGSFSKLVESR